MAMQRIANPWTSVRLRAQPLSEDSKCSKAHLDVFAQVAKLVDAGDLKSPDRNVVPVRLRPWAPLFKSLVTTNVY